MLTLWQLISGDSDMIFCGADCYGILEQAAAVFSGAQPFETYIQPDTGHGMNLHCNASGFYGIVQDFFESHG